MVQRRDVLKGVGAAGLMAALPHLAPGARAQDAPASAFAPHDLEKRAAALAASAYHEPSTTLPAPFATLNPPQYQAIHARQEAWIWQGGTRGFMIEPLHRGPIFATPVALNTVTNGSVAHIGYTPSQFDFGDLKVPDGLSDLGFSGFAIHYVDAAGVRHKLAIFQGASFFRAVAPGQHFGITARALSIRTADVRGEEFPQFREFWIETPQAAATSLRFHALIDSPSATAAVHFTLHTGDATIIDMESFICARQTLDHFGMGGMAAAYFYGPINAHATDQLRPQVHQVDGLSLNTGAGEWIWRPVANRAALQVSVFADKSPRGFGLLQRDRHFEDYEDETHHDEASPSLWIEPQGDWGDGGVELVEIPSSAEDNANIVASFRPAATLSAGGTQRYACRQFWCWQPPDEAPLARIVATLGGLGLRPTWRAFIVEFQSEDFGLADAANGLTAKISLGSGSLEGQTLTVRRKAKRVRVKFNFNPDSATMSELRMVLMRGGHNVSETWLYRWTA